LKERAVRPRVFAPGLCARKYGGSIMNISDILTRIETGADEQSFLAAKSAEPEEAPVLSLVETPESDACDPLIQALVSKLPKPNSI
jgi:hypothetical protein